MVRNSFLTELNGWLGPQKLSGVDRLAQTRQVHINSHAYTFIHHIESNLQSVI